MANIEALSIQGCLSDSETHQQRSILRGLDLVLACVDGILAFSEDKGSHKIHPQQLFDLLPSIGFRLKESKCCIAQPSVGCLAY